MTRRVPTVRQISWPAVIPQLLALTAAISIGWLATQSASGVFWGAVVYLLYSYGAEPGCSFRRLIVVASDFLRLNNLKQPLRPIRRVMTFSLAMPGSIVMMTPSAMSYREMALINIAFAYSQIGNGAQAKAYYQRAQEEFPDSAMAATALNLIDSIERSQVRSQNVP